MRAIIAVIHALSVLASILLALTASPAFANDLCGRPQEPFEALLERLAKVEKLREIHRDQAYVALHDNAKATTWTFTVAGHPAHPSVVCRRPVQDGAQMRLEMNVQCNASEAECQKLVRAFEELNARMIRELERQQKK